MKFFIKLNVLSIIYAFAFFINTEIMLNVYRIGRITGWNMHTVVLVTGTAGIVGFIFCTMLFYILAKNWMEGRNTSFWAILLWLPYFILFIYIFKFLFPITNAGDKPNPVSGFVILGESILYPVYLAIINFIGIDRHELIEEK